MHTIPLWVGLLMVLVAPSLIRAWDVGAVLDQALREAKVNRADAAYQMAVTEAQLARMISGCGPEHLSFDRVTRLPREIWLRLLPAIGEIYGLIPSADTRAERLARVVCRSAKATLRRDSEEDVDAQTA